MNNSFLEKKLNLKVIQTLSLQSFILREDMVASCVDSLNCLHACVTYVRPRASSDPLEIGSNLPVPHLISLMFCFLPSIINLSIEVSVLAMWTKYLWFDVFIFVTRRVKISCSSIMDVFIPWAVDGFRNSRRYTMHLFFLYHPLLGSMFLNLRGKITEPKWLKLFITL